MQIGLQYQTTRIMLAFEIAQDHTKIQLLNESYVCYLCGKKGTEKGLIVKLSDGKGVSSYPIHQECFDRFSEISMSRN